MIPDKTTRSSTRFTWEFWGGSLVVQVGCSLVHLLACELSDWSLRFLSEKGWRLDFTNFLEVLEILTLFSSILRINIDNLAKVSDET